MLMLVVEGRLGFEFVVLLVLWGSKTCVRSVTDGYEESDSDVGEWVVNRIEEMKQLEREIQGYSHQHKIVLDYCER